MIQLKGIAWDHPRCTLPLEASLGLWQELDPDVQVTWERRSLFSFGEGNIEELASNYDLVIFDHPFIGHIADAGLMLDLRQELTTQQVDALESDALGPTFRSYEWRNSLWALPLDAASQVSAYRPDLVDEPPASIDQVELLASRLNRRGLGVVTPLKQIDVFCLLLSLCANLGSPIEAENPEVMPDHVWAECMALLRRLHRLSIPGTEKINPIEAYDLMASDKGIAYSPFLFGYSNYARHGVGAAGGRLVKASDMPGAASVSPAGSCIGGAGIGISANCPHPKAAVEYARFLCTPSSQAGFYVQSGGQPASRSAWLDHAANDSTSGFFEATRRTLEASYLRPRFNGFMEAARATGPRLVAHLAEGADDKSALAGLRKAFADAGVSA